MNTEEILNDQVKPYNEQENKTVQLTRLFNKISKKYDFFNDLMSWGMAHIWRRKSVSYLKKYDPERILDIATGTGDMILVSCDLLKPKSIIGIDVSEQMMEIGKQKTNKKKFQTSISFEMQDAASLSFPDNSFDVVTIAFGLRNLEKLSQSIQEINRVLKSGGHFLIVEINEPHQGFMMRLYQIYMKIYKVLSGKLIDKNDFQYLTGSMGVFPKGKKLISLLSDYHFEIVKYKRFTFDVCSAYLLKKTS
ncbi:MAG: bifunctional demethylmenaquinone methyltransferase/2-methoxy-6-polyprenyl-1,4-benzoquinol methylase UbiE [Paludibacter sp.]|nr:bifunctional demethylmenaquinone methyltransferase/2-methoxy-6-polyprenyl-1,4-benzoquinol methylase UbiE [Paludibacter sp.]